MPRPAAMQSGQSEEKKQSIPVWIQSTVSLINVDGVEEQFNINAFISIYWKSSIPPTESDELSKPLNLLNLDEPKKEKLAYKTPIPFALIEPDWFFENGSIDPDQKPIITKATLHDKGNDIWYIELKIAGYFAETLELKNFPFDAQFLNIKLKLNRSDYFYPATLPQWFPDKDKAWFEEWGINPEKSLIATILDPANKEWVLLPPWVDYGMKGAENRKYKNGRYSLIRLRVKRKYQHYVYYNILPIMLINGLSFITISMTDSVDKISFVVTLLLTIAAGRSELVPEMPRAAVQTQIDRLVNIGYIMFGLMMIGFGINSDGLELAMDDLDNSDLVEIVMYGVCGLLWIGSVVYLLWIAKCRNVDDDPFWETRSDQEFESWDQEDYSKFIECDSNHCGLETCWGPIPSDYSRTSTQSI
eukprot:232522_1